MIDSRRIRLKTVFEGRCHQLEEARQGQRNYGSAVDKYTRARNAWRAFRGWPSRGGTPHSFRL
jgi:hypothetical protein